MRSDVLTVVNVVITVHFLPKGGKSKLGRQSGTSTRLHCVTSHKREIFKHLLTITKVLAVHTNAGITDHIPRVYIGLTDPHPSRFVLKTPTRIFTNVHFSYCNTQQIWQLKYITMYTQTPHIIRNEGY